MTKIEEQYLVDQGAVRLAAQVDQVEENAIQFSSQAEQVDEGAAQHAAPSKLRLFMMKLMWTVILLGGGLLVAFAVIGLLSLFGVAQGSLRYGFCAMLIPIFVLVKDIWVGKKPSS